MTINHGALGPDTEVRQAVATFARASEWKSALAAPHLVRSVPRRLCGDVRRLPVLLSAHAGARRADRRTAGARLHRPARLRARLVLRLAARQRAGGTGVQPRHAHALRQLGPPAQPASCRLEQPRPNRRRRRHLFVLPHGAQLSRAVAVASLALSPAAPSADRQRAVAAAGLPVALSRAVRHAARLGPRALVGLSDQRRPDLPVRHVDPRSWAGGRC